MCRTMLTLLLAGGALVLTWLGPPAMAQEITKGIVVFGGPALQATDGIKSHEDARFTWAHPDDSISTAAARIELKLASGGHPLEVAIAQRAFMRIDAGEHIDRHNAGAELRAGRGQIDRHGVRGARSIYAFVSSDNEALTWQGGSAVALQQQVRIGDHAAGMAYQRDSVQVSIAYVERQESTRVGHHSYSQDQNFFGVAVTMWF